MKLINDNVVVALPCYKLAQCKNADDILLLICEETRESSMYVEKGGIIFSIDPRAFKMKHSGKVELGIKSVFYANNQNRNALRVECWTVENLNQLLDYIAALDFPTVDLCSLVEINAVLSLLSFEAIDTSNRYQNIQIINKY